MIVIASACTQDGYFLVAMLEYPVSRDHACLVDVTLFCEKMDVGEL